jgi:hypothetical protein
MIMPGQVPQDELYVHQIAETWRVTQHNRPDESLGTVGDAVAHAVTVFPELRHHRPRIIIVLPPDSPLMWD